MPAGHSGGKPVLQPQTSRRREPSDKIHFTLDLFTVCFQFCGSDEHFAPFETRDQDHLSGATVPYTSPDSISHSFIVKLIKKKRFLRFSPSSCVLNLPLPLLPPTFPADSFVNHLTFVGYVIRF